MNIRVIVLLPCIFVSCLVAEIRAQEPADRSFTLKQVGPNAWAAVANLASTVPAGGNAGFVIGDDGVAVIDTFASTEAARQLVEEIRKLTPRPVKFVVNTHYHLDHVAGNGLFAEAGATVLAQRNVRGWIHQENVKLFGNDITPEQRAFVESFVAPTVGYDQGVDLYLGSRVIQVRSFPGHTGGDSVVLVPDARVAFAGDLFWRNIPPNMIDASIKPWIDTLSTLAKSDAGYTFVPGHGDVGNVQDVAAFRDYLATLYELVADARARGRSGNALSEAVMPSLTEKYGQWDFFKVLGPLNILQAEAELAGTKRIPQALPAN